MGFGVGLASGALVFDDQPVPRCCFSGGSASASLFESHHHMQVFKELINIP